VTAPTERPAASLKAIVRSVWAAPAAEDAPVNDAPVTLPGGNPVTEVPVLTPRFPPTMLAPVLVTEVPARIAKFAADPNATGASGLDPVIVDMEETTARELEAELVAGAVVDAVP
jgi:hypothetical protein